MSYIIEIDNLSKKFKEKIALSDINLKIKEGQIIGLIGGNGAGKTTLSEIIAGITKPTSGTIKYNFKFKKKHKELIGIQFQDSSYPSGLSVKDLVFFARNLHKINITNSELKSLLEKFQMRDIYRRKVRSLSGGQRQKINILLSILHNPKFVILDELTTGLDIFAREEIISFAKQFIKDKGISALLVTHQMEEVKELANRVVVLSNGKIIKDDTIDNIEKENKSLSKYMVNLISSTQDKGQDDFFIRPTFSKTLKNNFKSFCGRFQFKRFNSKKRFKKGQDKK